MKQGVTVCFGIPTEYLAHTVLYSSPCKDRVVKAAIAFEITSSTLIFNLSFLSGKNLVISQVIEWPLRISGRSGHLIVSDAEGSRRTLRNGRRIESNIGGSLGRSGRLIVSDVGGSLGRSGRWIYLNVGGSLGRSGRLIVSDVGGSLGRSKRRIISDIGGSLGRSGRWIVLDVWGS
jgi:hypothetical protein